ncbi:hypothetical protein [Wenjunlia vitaminophila]|uniref:hypothetical protein n=1 Tax=Wenjunlia vitaminophila TaxID=76728 RepID=UPI0003AA5BB5|nr:hypothetical protein [Wenjunlia vitaminophila]
MKQRSRGHDLIRMPSRDGKPTGLGDAFAHYGRIFKTLTCSSSSRTRDTGG